RFRSQAQHRDLRSRGTIGRDPSRHHDEGAVPHQGRADARPHARSEHPAKIGDVHRHRDRYHLPGSVGTQRYNESEDAMRRVCTLVGLTLFALAARANVAHATTTGETQSGEIKSLAVVSASGRAEVVIAVDNSVSIQDFSLADPSRVVLDLKGAKLSAPTRLYDHVPRGGVTNIRVAQYRENTVRVVIDLDADHKYAVTRDANGVHVAIDAPAGAAFTAWRASPQIT